MTDEKQEKKTQELYMQFKLVNQQIEELQKQVQSIEESINDTLESIRGVEEISKQQEHKEILVPIVSGVFAKAEIKDNKEFIVNVGSGTAATKSYEQVKSLLEKQHGEMQKAQNMLIDQLHQLTLHAKEMRQQLKSLVEKQK
jgi:prefoldin alpha subunit